MVTKEMSEVATEITVILENMSDDLQNRIPKKFSIFIQNISSATYEFKYDNTKLLKDQKLKPLTKGVISLIYRDYICSQEEKQIYIKESMEILKKQESEKREKYNPDNIFKNNKENTSENIVKNIDVEETLMEIQNGAWYKIIFIKLKNFVNIIISNFKK